MNLTDLSILAGAAVLGGGGVWAYYAVDTQPGVYDISQAEAYTRLANADLNFTAPGVTDAVQFAVSANGSSNVTWETVGAKVDRSCLIKAIPFGEGGKRTQVTVNCDKPLKGKAPIEELRDELFQNAIVEMADATIRGVDLPPLDQQIFEAAAASLGAKPGNFNRALADAVATRRAISSQIEEIRGEIDPENADEEDLDDFYDDATRGYNADSGNWGN